MTKVLVAGAICLVLLGCESTAEPFQLVEFKPPPEGLVAGSPDAQTVLVEFGSHGCPGCRKLVDSVWPSLDEQFVKSKQVHYQYLEAGSPHLDPLAAFVECESVSRGVFAARARLNWLIANAKDSLATMLTASTCANSGARKIRRREERSLAERMKIRGTPSIILGRRHGDGRVVGWVIVGALPRDSLLTLVRYATEVTNR